MPQKTQYLKSEISCQYISISTDRKPCDILSSYVTDRILGFYSFLLDFAKSRSIEDPCSPPPPLGGISAKTKADKNMAGKWGKG
jgi:hypothetical protein